MPTLAFCIRSVLSFSVVVWFQEGGPPAALGIGVRPARDVQAQRDQRGRRQRRRRGRLPIKFHAQRRQSGIVADEQRAIRAIRQSPDDAQQVVQLRLVDRRVKNDLAEIRRALAAISAV